MDVANYSTTSDAPREDFVPFRHTPLKDPATYIRLLKAEPTHGGLPSYTLSTWPIEQAPGYNAISYTWGEPYTTTILINNYPFEVRRSCRKALMQAHNFEEGNFLWIDSICINQDDINEKNHQVHRMFAVYENANKVLACLGDHHGDSEFLFDITRRAEMPSLSPMPDTDKLYKGLWSQTESLQREHQVGRLHASFLAFGWRPYWSRLWIVQEVAAGDEKTYVLCGRDSMKMDMLFVISRLVRKTLNEDEDQHNPLSAAVLVVVLHWRIHCLRLYHIFESLSSSKCQDIRDKIYGVVALINWESEGIKHVRPDYSRCIWSLAKELVTGIDVTWVIDLLRMFEIDAGTPELVAVMQQRISTSIPAKQCTDMRSFFFIDLLAARLSGDNDKLSCAFKHAVELAKDQSRDVAELLAPLNLLALQEYEWCKMNGREPKKVYSHSGDLVALVCGQARPGDDLVHHEHRSMLHKCFVLHPTRGMNFRVVGNGILVNSTLMGSRVRRKLPTIIGDALPEHDLFKANLQLNATPDDIMLFFVGVEEDIHRSRDPHTELLHLMTGPMSETGDDATLLSNVDDDGGDIYRLRPFV